MADKDVAASLHEVLKAGSAWRADLTPANRERLHAAMATAMDTGLSPHTVAEAAGKRFTPIKVREIVDDWNDRQTHHRLRRATSP